MILNRYVTLSSFLELIINGLWTKYQLKIIDVNLLAPCTSPCFFRNSQNAEVMARFSGSELLVMAGTAEPNDGVGFCAIHGT